MTDRDLMLAFQCCSPSSRNERDCSMCPLSNSDNCHTELCETAIDYIIRKQGETERFARGVDAVIDAINNLHSLY